MMKKIYITLLLCLLSQPVFAKTAAVQALQDFTTENPPHTMNVKLLEDLYLDDETILFANGCIVEGKIIDVTDPKRLKRDAAFSFLPIKMTDENGKSKVVTGYYPAKYTVKLDKGQLVKNAALGIGSYYIKGLSLGYNAIEGAMKNEKDNRFKSSVSSVYENSPLSYVEKGDEIIIKKDDIFLLNFKLKENEEENLPNYEYTPLVE